MRNKFEKIFRYVIFYVPFIIILNINYLSKNHKISIRNSMCYSWIPYNKYEIRSNLCKINCSYVRHKLFPLNTPLLCKRAYSLDKNNTFKIYVFNTSTYGKEIKQYRFFYQNSYV